MTLREVLTARYPTHIQRILECVYEQRDEGSADDLLQEEYVVGGPLTRAFHWRSTSEGWRYWAGVAGVLDRSGNHFGGREAS